MAMGMDTDFLVADPSELRRVFVGWRRPAETRGRRSFISPFSKQPMERLTWVPDASDTLEVEPFPGGTLGLRLSHLTHLELRNLDPMVLSELLVAVVGGDSSEWLSRIGDDPPRLVCPDDTGESSLLWELPEAFVCGLAGVTRGQADDIRLRWVGSDELWSPSGCVDVLCDLASLATTAVKSAKGLYYFA